MLSLLSGELDVLNLIGADPPSITHLCFPTSNSTSISALSALPPFSSSLDTTCPTPSSFDYSLSSLSIVSLSGSPKRTCFWRNFGSSGSGWRRKVPRVVGARVVCCQGRRARGGSRLAGQCHTGEVSGRGWSSGATIDFLFNDPFSHQPTRL